MSPHNSDKRGERQALASQHSRAWHGRSGVKCAARRKVGKVGGWPGSQTAALAPSLGIEQQGLGVGVLRSAEKVAHGPWIDDLPGVTSRALSHILATYRGCGDKITRRALRLESLKTPPVTCA